MPGRETEVQTQPRLEKIHVTIDMSSVTGGLCQNFGAMSSITVGAKISAHDEERNFGT